MRHRGFGPVGLKDEVSFLLRHVTFDEALLVDAWDGIFDAQGSREVFENPLRRAGEPWQCFLSFEVPVEEIAGVGLGPVAVFGDAGLASGIEVGEAALVGALSGGNLREDLVGIFGVPSGMAVCSPIGVG